MRMIGRGAWLLAAVAVAGCQLAPGAVAGTAGPPPHQTVLPATALVYPTLPPEWTATWTPTPGAATATRTPAPSATLVGAYSQRLAAAQAAIAQALKLGNNGQCAAALAQWNQIIAQVPEYADGYYQRAVCIVALDTGLAATAEENRAVQAQALADMDMALSLDARKGNYFYEREVIYHNLAALELYRVDQDYWNTLSLADAQAALRFGTRISGADREAAFRQIDVGHPDLAAGLFSHLPPEPGRTLVSDATLQEGLAESLFGEGFLDQALPHLNLALRLSPSHYKTQLKVLILLSQGQPAAALAQLSAAGTLCGCDYYIRALIEYQLGQPKQAQADIDTGSAQTWERGGLRSYVLGLLALDRGDTATGQQLIQEAQASLPRADGPVLLKQITDKLKALGVSRLNPTPYAAATAMPTPP